VAARAPETELLTIDVAAELLGVSDQTLRRRWDKEGRVRAKSHPLNRYRLYPRNTVLDFKGRLQSDFNVSSR
jgi:predicted site-specific integrase-resolvase